MNDPASAAGRQAAYFAKAVEDYSGGAVRVEIHPSSLLGTLDEQLAQVASGFTSIHHTTAAAFGSLLPQMAVLDSPYLFDDVDHLLRATAAGSPLMAKLGGDLERAAGLRILYTFYFGTRQLTCDRPVYRPADLAGMKIRAIPYPTYIAAAAGLGAQPVPIDWARVPVALATKAVDGQENPVNTILSARLYEFQRYLVLTGHIRGAEIVVVNDGVWRAMNAAQRRAVERAAGEAADYGTRLTRDQEAADLAALAAHGMTVIGPAEGLDLAAFKAEAERLRPTYAKPEWSEYYDLIAAAR
jgi:tripartite ATP-independent transporter DctP family solute receptor